MDRGTKTVTPQNFGCYDLNVLQHQDWIPGVHDATRQGQATGQSKMERNIYNQGTTKTATHEGWPKVVEYSSSCIEIVAKAGTRQCNDPNQDLMIVEGFESPTAISFAIGIEACVGGRQGSLQGKQLRVVSR